MNRAEVAADVEIKHERMMIKLRKAIREASSDSEARDMFVRAVLSLPGVAGDPVTVPDIGFLTDTLLSKVSVSVPDTVDVRTDKCWREGVHRAHTWLSSGRTYMCEGQPPAL